jgi:hypothetical protein
MVNITNSQLTNSIFGNNGTIEISDLQTREFLEEFKKAVESKDKNKIVLTFNKFATIAKSGTEIIKFLALVFQSLPT